MEILIIDDEKDICLLLSHYLKKFELNGVCAHSLTDGLNKFDENLHEIIFLDINLPDGNGLDAIPSFLEKNDNMKVIVISAYDSSIDRQKANRQGAFKFLKKPFSIKDIKDIIETHIQQ